MEGGAGNDTYVVDDSGDFTTEGLGVGGIDTVESQTNFYGLTFGSGLENLTLVGPNAVGGYGNEPNNVIVGNENGNQLNGDLGDDQIIGNAGNDSVVGGQGRDVLFGGEGNDFIWGDNGSIFTGGQDDTLYGDSGDDFLFGEDGNDLLYGGAGYDTLNGGAGNDLLDGGNGFEGDQMAGGVGNDTYVVDQGYDQVVEAANEGADTVETALDNYWIPWFSNIENLMFTGSQSNWGTGNELDNIIISNVGNDFLDGRMGNDILRGGAGQDQLVGGEGDDALEGEVGDDLLWGDGSPFGDGQDVLNGGEGDDVLFGDGGNDILTGGVGRDQLNGGAGDDILYIDSEDTVNAVGDRVLGESGIDQLHVQGSGGVIVNLGLAQVEQVFGGEGDDQFFNLHGVTADTGYTVLGNGGNDNITGGNLTDYLYGGDGSDFLGGSGGADELRGEDGNDTLGIDAADTLISGGEGFDTAMVDDSTGVTLDLGATQIERVYGGSGNDVFMTSGVDAVASYGYDGDDVLSGGIGNDTLEGGNGSDFLDGGLGLDSLIGGAGDDTYMVDDAGDAVTENMNEGTDTVQSSITYTLGVNVENLTLTGSAAVNATGNSLANSIVGNDAANVLDGATGADGMSGGQGDDIYVFDNAGDVVTELANEGTDTVQSSLTYTLGANVENLTLTGSSAINGTGNTLNNILTGNSGANVLTGGTGNDTYVIGAGDSVVETAGAGTDTVQSALTYTLGANLENLTLIGSSAINGTGNSLNNVLTGNSGANVLTGGAGNDTYVIGVGDSIVESNNNGTDTVQSSVAWTLAANLENLTLIGPSAINGTGNSANNVMIGNSAANVLSGANGADTLRGGLGNDTVNGGNGNDTFLIGRGDGQDLVQDSSGSADKLLYDAGINPLDLVISRQANDLRLSIHGSTDTVTVQNWFTSSSNRTETIQAGNGQTLLSTQVDQLIQAMASFTQQTGLTWDQGIDQQPAQVQTILAATWQ